MELGNALFGNSRGSYPVDRDWQEDFCSFLENAGFDFYGYIYKDELNKYKKEETGTYLTYKDCKVSAEELEKLGTFLRYDEPVLWREDDGAEYRTSIYQFKGKMYSLEPRLEGEYYEMRDIYESTLWTWEETLSDEEFNKYLDGEVMIPYEIQHIEPNPKDYNKIFKVWEVEEVLDISYYFDNGTFIVRPYYWGSSEELAQKPNFVYKDVEIQWYKWPFRDSYISKNISYNEFCNIIDRCKRSLV